MYRYLALLVLLAGCGDEAASVACGAGTEQADGVCLPASTLVCAAGTSEVGGACVVADPLECGAGTHAVEGACVADVTCGAGTLAEGQWCVPEADPLVCGAGTVVVDGACVIPEDQAPVCGAGTVLRGVQCVALSLQYVALPFPEGAEARVGQGSHGSASHADEVSFALDFPLPEGTPFAAARGGTVLRARDDSDTGCGEARCNDDANYIVIDHGDGTRGNYAHLQQDGALVEEGDVVCAGDIIGRTGNTGFSTGPHLHFDVQDLLQQTLPLRMEVFAASEGVPVSGLVVRSQSVAPNACEGAPEWSMCPADLFAQRGVLFDAPPPCARVAWDVPYEVRGRVTAGTQSVFVTAFDAGAERWLHRCMPTAADGSFTTSVIWEAEQFGGTYTHLMFSAAPNDECRPMYGWDHAPQIMLR